MTAADTRDGGGLLRHGAHLCRTLQHPIALSALVALVFNDHWLKQHYPGWLSGKLSDVAGLVLLPLWLEIVLRLAGAPARPGRLRAFAVLCSLVAFSAMQLFDSVNVVYSWGLAVAQWPVRALWSGLSGVPTPALHPVVSLADHEDLVALPALWLSYWVPVIDPMSAAACSSTRASATIRQGLTLCVLSVGLSLTPEANAAPSAAPGDATVTSRPAKPERNGCAMDGTRETPQAYCHSGFFAELSANTAWIWVNSERSISNDFAQAIPSSAFGVSIPSLAWHLGGSPKPGLVIGGRVSTLILQGAEIETLGQHLYLSDLQLAYVDVGVFVMYYLDPGSGTFVRGSLNLGGIDAGEAQGSVERKGREDDPLGPSIVVGAGHGLWLHPQWTLGVALELQYFRSLNTDKSSLFAPNVALQIAWH